MIAMQSNIGLTGLEMGKIQKSWNLNSKIVWFIIIDDDDESQLTNSLFEKLLW